MNLTDFIYNMSTSEEFGKWSDLHIKEGLPVAYRDKNGTIIRTDTEEVTKKDFDLLLSSVLEKHQGLEGKERNVENMLMTESGDMDFALAVKPDNVEDDLAPRFRCSLYFYNGRKVGLVMRKINSDIISIEKLNLPKVSREFNQKNSGLVLVTGPTGSGKSTTLAAMIQEINETRAENIITVEDPIEYIYEESKSIISQREIGAGKDSTSFHKALRGALRQDPDVILVGEIRDSETANMCLEAAQTGHLVFGTLHTRDAIGTITRFIQLFDNSDKGRVRHVLSDSLVGIISQALVPKKGGGKVMIPEVVSLSTLSIRNTIREEGKAAQMNNQFFNVNYKETGNISLNQSLLEAVLDDKIEVSTALEYTIDFQDMVKKLKDKDVDVSESVGDTSDDRSLSTPPQEKPVNREPSAVNKPKKESPISGNTGGLFGRNFGSKK